MQNSDKPLVVVICGDPGGANAVAPVIEYLREDGCLQLMTYVYRQAHTIMKERGIEHVLLSEQISMNEIITLFAKNPTSLLLTGTSYNGVDLEKKFIMAARNLGIPSLGVMDSWINYAVRFRDEKGLLSYVPDRIAIMDERARDEMISEGFHPDSLVITGQPAFDDLYPMKATLSAEKTNQIKRGFGAKSDSKLILFLSQPLHNLYGDDPSNPLYGGYTEKTVLAALIHSLEEINKQNDDEIILVIRPHPREDPKDYLDYKSDTISIFIVKHGNPQHQIMASDLVVGMSTILLVEACYLQKIVVSIQPELKIPDPVPTNQTGFSIAVYTEEHIITVIQQFLYNSEIRHSHLKKLGYLRNDTKAALLVAKCIYQMIENAMS